MSLSFNMTMFLIFPFWRLGVDGCTSQPPPCPFLCLGLAVCYATFLFSSLLCTRLHLNETKRAGLWNKAVECVICLGKIFGYKRKPKIEHLLCDKLELQKYTRYCDEVPQPTEAAVFDAWNSWNWTGLHSFLESVGEVRVQLTYSKNWECCTAEEDLKSNLQNVSGNGPWATWACWCDSISK